MLLFCATVEMFNENGFLSADFSMTTNSVFYIVRFNLFSKLWVQQCQPKCAAIRHGNHSSSKSRVYMRPAGPCTGPGTGPCTGPCAPPAQALAHADEVVLASIADTNTFAALSRLLQNNVGRRIIFKNVMILRQLINW